MEAEVHAAMMEGEEQVAEEEAVPEEELTLHWDGGVVKGRAVGECENKARVQVEAGVGRPVVLDM